MNYLLIAALVAGFAGGWMVNGWRYDAERLAAEQGMKEALEATAQEIAKLEIIQKTIYQEVQTRVIEKPVYRTRHDADTFRLLNDAINGHPGGDKLPKADTAK